MNNYVRQNLSSGMIDMLMAAYTEGLLDGMDYIRKDYDDFMLWIEQYMKNQEEVD